MRISGDVDPRGSIGAIFGVTEGGGYRHLGTGSIVGDGTVVLTAEHVIRGFGGDLVLAVIVEGNVLPIPISLLASDEQRDLALLRVHGYTATDPLTLGFGVQVSYNTDLLTLEYAQTEYVEGVYQLNPAARRGHKTRTVHAEKLGAIAGQGALELSFPALQGASGAPVMIESTDFVPKEQRWAVIGVLVANVAYHAIPAQIVDFVGHDDSYIEERRYMLPQGLAVAIDHLRPLYDRIVGS